jgi:hypothetical protein
VRSVSKYQKGTFFAIVGFVALAGCATKAQPPTLAPVTAYTPAEVDQACIQRAADLLRTTLHVKATDGRAIQMPPNGYDPSARRKVELDTVSAGQPITYEFACIVTPDGRAEVQPMGRRATDALWV